MLAITVNGHPLRVAAVVERGHVLVPARAFFAAAGLPDRRDDSKDAYVELRDLAREIGAVVRYDARTKIVSITTAAKPQTANANVTGLTPAPDAPVNSAYPTISATLDRAAAVPGSVSLTVDGQDVTQFAAFDGSTITYLPRSGLARGLHTVVFSGKTAAQQPFSAQWSFTTDLAAPPDASAFDPAQFRFYTSGPASYSSGDWLHFVLVAPPNGTAEVQVCGLGQFPMIGTPQSEMYTGSIPAPPGVWIPSCQVTAVYTSWNGTRTYVPVPVYIGLFTKQRATPRPRMTSRPVPSEPRKPEPAPAPVPTPHPASASTPRPAPPVHRPIVPRPRRTPGL